MAVKVLDSSALVAYFRDDNGAETIENLLLTAAKKDSLLLMSDVSFVEVKSLVLAHDGEGGWVQAARILEALPISFCPTNRVLADQAAEFKARFTITIPQAIVAALAKDKKAELFTADQGFKVLQRDLKLVWLE